MFKVLQIVHVSLSPICFQFEEYFFPWFLFLLCNWKCTIFTNILGFSLGEQIFFKLEFENMFKLMAVDCGERKGSFSLIS